ncbi:MAG TPA: hydrolase, partial [Polyangia bacterium]
MPTKQSPPSQAVTPTGCCPPFDPAPWQDKEIVWKDKTFVKDHVLCLFHVPLNMGHKVQQDMELIERAHATSSDNL